MKEFDTIQGRPLSDRIAPWSGFPVEQGWNFHDAIYELESLLDGLFRTWEEVEDSHIGNRLFAIYYGARRLCDDISDVHQHELEKAHTQGQDEPIVSEEVGEETLNEEPESDLSPSDFQ